jgi:hypothetical protein
MTMTYDEIVDQIVAMAEGDQSIDDVVLSSWISQGIDRINVAMKSNIPNKLSGSDEPLFDKRFHEALVLFAVSKYRAADASYNDADYFMNEFNTMLMTMERDMVVLPSLMGGDQHLQITAVAGQQIYSLSLPNGSYYDVIEVYVNDVLKTYITDYTINMTTKLLTFTGTTTFVDGDKITVKYENNSDLNNPPYGWWGW